MDPCGGCLTEDLLIEILKRLPVKSLLRFTSVAKPWSRLINDPDLVTSHLRFNKSSSPSALAIGTGRDCFRHKELEHQFEHFRIHNTTEKATFPFPWRPRPNPKKYKPYVLIIGHCNGVVLARDIDTHLVYEPTKAIPEHVRVERYIICNPIARRFRILPESGIELPNLTFEDEHLDSFPSYQESAFGLGFVDNLVYKIVRVTYGILKGRLKAFEQARAEVLDSRSGRWREVSVNAGISYEDLHIRGVYNSFDGCLYWLGRGSGERKRYYSTLVSFHLVSEVWHETLFPYKSRRESNYEDGVFGVYGVCERVGILGESVVMFVGDQRDELVCNVWKMNKRGDQKVCWTHMYKFDFKGSPEGFSGDGRLLLRSKCDGSLVLYDSRKMDDACFGFTVLDCQVSSLAPDFVESLVLLDGESRVLAEDASEEELEKPKSFWEEDEDLGDVTSLFDENL